jgi:hypothetical protein
MVTYSQHHVLCFVLRNLIYLQEKMPLDVNLKLNLHYCPGI